MNSIRQTRMGSKRMSRRDRHGQAQLLAPDLLLPKSPLVLAVPDSSSLIITHIIAAQIRAPKDKNVLQTAAVSAGLARLQLAAGSASSRLEASRPMLWSRLATFDIGSGVYAMLWMPDDLPAE